MIIENLSTLEINKLSKAQYERELAAGRIDENALYLTPDEEVEIPTKTSELINDSGFITSYTDNKVGLDIASSADIAGDSYWNRMIPFRTTNGTSDVEESLKCDSRFSYRLGDGLLAVPNINITSGSVSTIKASSITSSGLINSKGLSIVDDDSIGTSESYSAHIGYGLVSSGGVNGAQTVVGKYNTAYAGVNNNDYEGTNGSAFVVGTGISRVRKNGFRVGFDSTCYGASSFTGSGADYAEYYEWLDGNSENEDRRGYFVTLDGNKIRKANPNDDYILGVISATPVVVGNSCSEGWHGMHVRDIFGAPLTETVQVEEKVDEETGEVTPAHTYDTWVINPEYDSTKEYKGRHERQEWGAVGTHGQLVVIDDGTCEVNGYCVVADGGMATKADGKSEYRVIERIDDTHIRIVIK